MDARRSFTTNQIKSNQKHKQSNLWPWSLTDFKLIDQWLTKMICTFNAKIHWNFPLIINEKCLLKTETNWLQLKRIESALKKGFCCCCRRREKLVIQVTRFYQQLLKQHSINWTIGGVLCICMCVCVDGCGRDTRSEWVHFNAGEWLAMLHVKSSCLEYFFYSIMELNNISTKIMLTTTQHTLRLQYTVTHDKLYQVY